MKSGNYAENILRIHKFRFDINLLKKISLEIQNNLHDINVKWVKYIKPVSIRSLPSNYVPSNINDCNMVIIERNGIKLLEIVKYPHFGSSLFIYENNLKQDEINTLSKIFKQNEIPSIQSHKKTIEFIKKRILPLILIFIILQLSLIPLLYAFTNIFGWTTGVIITMTIYFTFLIIVIIISIMFRKILKI